ncbi:MAG TPA: hypothetical protein ENG95_01050 [Nitrospirae bacterium]|nr:hypothetical protein BMS3Abin10_00026 [bacterium BMS3Abin10]GBE37896.1 hypothetical protein BMS3Bbin08_00494 [bacterium BMS3Bbin08]HDH50240.1 hypothetical protein [Nitrospirota bacterium]HDK17635.1 hypothetical protein [Nitrospirota bacterium]HDK81120.1 hypothetical protein [Nitrospirota bacterium]
MKKLVILIIPIIFLFISGAEADNSEQKGLHDMHMIMEFMDHGLCSALEGANLQMLGQMGMAKTLDKDAIVHGTIMVKDGKAMIKEMLEGKAMRTLYKEGGFDKKIMDDLHELGERMLKVIEQVEKLHEEIEKKN